MEFSDGDVWLKAPKAPPRAPKRKGEDKLKITSKKKVD